MATVRNQRELDATFGTMKLVSVGTVKCKGVFQNESWSVIGRSTREEHLALVRGVREEAVPFIPWHNVISGISPAWREARHTWSVSGSRCDTQRYPFLFFL